MRVGPDSAGADPGPACYRRGGPLTVTDANVCVGKIQPRHFPAIFGTNGDQPLDIDVVTTKFAALAERDLASDRTRAHAAAGGGRFLAHRCRQYGQRDQAGVGAEGPRRNRFALQCFGGAGGQHACLVADALGMETVFIHPYAGVLSAYGMGLADQTAMREQAVEIPLERDMRCRTRNLADRLGAGSDGGAAGPGRRARARHRRTAICICATPAPRLH